MNLHDSVEAVVRAEPVDGELLLERVRDGARRSTRARSGAAVVASAAAAVALVAAVLPDSVDQPAPAQPAVASPVPAVPAGAQAVSWHGVQLFVPQGWKLGDQFCGTAQSDTVLKPGPVLGCLPPYVPGLTVVEYRDGIEELPKARDAEVSGYPATRGSVRLTQETGVREVLVLPELDVTVSVRSPDRARARALLDTAQVVDVDVLGCAARLPSTEPPVPEVPGAAEHVLPGDPVAVVLCQYGDLRLESSARLPAASVRTLQSRLDAAPVGSSPSHEGKSASASACRASERAPLVLQATYDDGSRLQVFTGPDSCTGPDPDNGARQVRAGRWFYRVLAGTTSR